MKNRLCWYLVLMVTLLAPLAAVAAPAPVAKTGAPGDTAGVAWPYPRFVVNLQADGVTPDGTVTDRLTGLVWLQNANCFGAQNWATALASANTLASPACGLADGSTAGQWRLPNRKELWSLVDLQYVNPALPNTAGTAHWSEGVPFNGVQSNWYWSSSTGAGYTGGAWGVGMDYGGVYSGYKGGDYYVWPVRAGQLGSLGLSPASNDFGPIPVGELSSPQTFTLTNNGIGNLNIGGFSTVDGDSGEFGVDPGDGTGGTCGTTKTLAPAASCTVDATFTPASSGSKATTVRIASDDPNKANTDVPLSGSGVVTTTTVTIATDPSGLGVTVDNIGYSAPQTFEWTPGSSHTVATKTSQGGVNGILHHYASWSDAGAMSHTITAPATPATYTASFTTHYQLTAAVVPAGSGVVTPASGGWYSAGTVVPVKATPNSGYKFTSWSGSISGSSATTSVTMNGSKSIIANLTGSNPLSASIGAKSGTTPRKWNLALKNSGASKITAAKVTGLSLIQTYGVKCTPVIAASQFPLLFGNIAPGGTANKVVSINFNTCAKTARFTATISYSGNSGAISGASSFINQFK